MQLASFVLLLPAPNNALAFFSGGTSSMPTSPLLSPVACSRPYGIRVNPNYSTKLYLLPNKWLTTIRCSNRVNSSDKNVESETEVHNITNATVLNNENETLSIATGDDEILSMGMKSGWANFGLSLLPSWPSATELQSDTLSTSGDTDSHSNVSIVSEGSTSAPDNVDGNTVYDSDLDNEFTYDEFTNVKEHVPETNDGIIRTLFRYTVAVVQWGGKKLLDRIAISPSESSDPYFDEMNLSDESMLDNITYSNNASSSEYPIDPHDKTEAEEVDNSLDHKQRGRSRRRHLQNQNTPPIFTSLESIDISSTTLAKHKRWERRRRRALVAYKVTKNAVFLFVVTFFAGNVSQV